MQVIILAAGMGKRLGQKTQKHTKSMVKILGKTFLEHSLDKLTKFQISRIIIVIGYFGDEVREVIGDHYNGVPVFYVENKDYETTNNIYSLFLAKDYLQQEDTLLLESDLIYEETIIRKLLNNPFPNLAVVDKYKSYMDGTVVKINSRDEITAFISKKHFDYMEIDSYYKTVNIYKLSKDFLENEYIPFLDAYCRVMGKNAYYEQVMKVLLSLERNSLKALKLNGEKWYEVDDLQDYDVAETLFMENDESLKKYYSLYGGYWRFDKLKDFCYLVNPYFPSQRMLTEMKHGFEKLLSNYPSGQNVHKILASNILNISKDFLLVGNGAAELIGALLPELTGNVGVILPTFGEYFRRLRQANICFFIPNNPDFSYDLKDLKEYAKEVDTLILINPNNPNGCFINKNDILSLLDVLKYENKRLILDESFIDFADNFGENTLLVENILKEYKNLIIIKSISKSYGVPGLRLGILATTDLSLLEKVYNRIPVWNLNSFAEFFLQILCKYKEEYKDSCLKVIKDRETLFDGLRKIKYLRPIKSEANYIFCEVLNKFRSADLCKKLLLKGFLIKDCCGKKGINEKQYIRIAVKSKKDNDDLLRALEEV